MISAVFPKDAEDSEKPGAVTWLSLLWACNDIERNFFGAPCETGTTASPTGGEEWFERYPHARLAREGMTVRMTATSEHGEQVLLQAAARLGVKVVQS